MTTSAVADRSTGTHDLQERFEQLPLLAIVPSKTNPRKHFDEGYLSELALSIAEKGVIEPIVCRPKAGQADVFEIVAGECRYRAAQRAQLDLIPAVIRCYSNEQALEIQLIENIHRKDLTALEQAAGYRALITQNPGKHTAASIATRVGMSEAWVWDRLKLNDLIPEAKTLLEQDRIATGHAVLIARQKPEDQKRILDPDDARNRVGSGGRAGLWQTDHAFEFDSAADPTLVKILAKDKFHGLKAVSVRELESWIATHIRFDIAHAAKAVPLEFAATADHAKLAEERPGRGKKLIPITFAYRVADDARDEKERTYGAESWERADGQEKSKTCEHSVLGVVVAGAEQYGKTLEVCVARDKCRVHFGDVIKQREKNQKLRESGQAKKADKAEEARDARYRREEEQRQAAQARWNKLGPALKSAILAAAHKQAKVPQALLTDVLKELRLPTVTVAALPKALLIHVVTHELGFHYHGNEKAIAAWAKRLGVNVKAIEQKALPAAAKKTTAA